MIFEYATLLEEVKTALEKIGFLLEKDSDFVAIFSGESEWKIEFEGERYVRPVIGIVLSRSRNQRRERVLVEILMAAFADPRIPSLVNQLAFLTSNFYIIDSHDVELYLIKYRELNIIE